MLWMGGTGASSAGAKPAGASSAGASSAGASSAARTRSEASLAAAAVPGRISELVAGESGSGVAVKYQAEAEFAPSCAERAAAGFNSGMGEIFRRVAQISPIATSAEPKAEAEGESAGSRRKGGGTPEVRWRGFGCKYLQTNCLQV